MKRKHKGRKIYKTKEKNYYGKSPFGKFMSAVLTVLLIGGIGFIGYSVAEPIINYTQHKGDKPEVEPTAADTTAYADKETEPATKPESVQSTGTHPDEIVVGAALKTSDLQNSESLQSAISALPADTNISYIEIPLKSSDGFLWYGSSVYDAQTVGAVHGSMSLDEIVSVVESNGYKAAAVISTFEDSCFPAAYYDAGYVTYADGSQWIDNEADAGGKPWMSPYSQKALDYLSEITAEISAAGFDRIICSGLVFPPFRQSDLDLLGERYGRSDRCMALTSAANLMYDKAMSNGASMQVEISAADILGGRGDVLQPMLLSATSVILRVDIDELGNSAAQYDFSGSPGDIALKCITLTADKLSDFNVSVRLTGSSLTAAQVSDAREKIAEYGYDSFIFG